MSAPRGMPPSVSGTRYALPVGRKRALHRSSSSADCTSWGLGRLPKHQRLYDLQQANDRPRNCQDDNQHGEEWSVVITAVRSWLRLLVRVDRRLVRVRLHARDSTSPRKKKTDASRTAAGLSGGDCLWFFCGEQNFSASQPLLGLGDREENGHFPTEVVAPDDDRLAEVLVIVRRAEIARDVGRREDQKNGQRKSRQSPAR